MSLGGLALSTGLIVDDAVVVLENIFRHIERDRMSTWDAAIAGTNEIISAVFASTWTIMVVFLPLLFIKGQAGQMFTQFAAVVVFALAISLLDAATLVPMLATRLMPRPAHAESAGGEATGGLFGRFGRWFEALDRAYRSGLGWAIHHRPHIVGGALLITLGALPLMAQLGCELMPQTDSGDFTVVVKMPIGTALAETDETMRQVERILIENPNVQTAFAAAGTTLNLRGATTQLIPFQGSVTVKLKDKRRQTTLQVIDDLRRKVGALPGVRAQLTQSDLVSLVMTGGLQNVEVDIFGEDLGVLSDLANQAMGRTRGIAGFENVDVNWQEAMPEIRWVVDRQKASELGLSFSDIASTIDTATNGFIASYYQEKGFQYPIIVQQPEGARKTVAEMERLVVSPSTPGTPDRGILLSQVAHAVYGVGPSEITRLDRQRYIAVTGSPQGRSAGEIQSDIGRALADWHLPTGYYWDWGTTQKRQAEEFGGLGLAVALAIGLIYMLLASQFENFLHPLTILLTVPLAITGVVLGLFLTGRAFGLTAFVGGLLLVGIVVKNGILLVDYTNRLRQRGLAREEAILTAAPTRLRPILMTASAAILGMLPIATGLGRGSEVQAPMATAVIGGLSMSTFLTLFVVPVAYSLLDDLTRLFRGRREGPTDARPSGQGGDDPAFERGLKWVPDGGKAKGSVCCCRRRARLLGPGAGAGRRAD
jgi:hydrophobic/amphiphilic exporter-1 (mainly G- bacteria), HAE1 family